MAQGQDTWAARMDDLTLEQIGEAIRTAAMAHDGFGGNCAAFARVLDKVLGGEGDYVIIDGGHYEFATHVGPRYRGMILDADGVSTREDWIARWADEEEDEDEDEDEEDEDHGFEEFHDPDGTHVLALADLDGGSPRVSMPSPWRRTFACCWTKPVRQPRRVSRDRAQALTWKRRAG
jgi:hypothetical protein